MMDMPQTKRNYSVTQINSDVRQVLEQCTCQGNLISLPNTQLDRKLYMAVNKIFENLGGKWNRKLKKHVFEEDVEEAFTEVVSTGFYEARLDELNKVYNFFETPRELAELMVAKAEIKDSDTVLEPSAGKGAIARVIRDNTQADLECYELHKDNANILFQDGFAVLEIDFLNTDQRFDVIVANPPFSKGRDVKHILHMLKLADTVVAVAGAGIEFRRGRLYDELTEEIERRGGYIESLPEGSFKESGTMVQACLVVVNR